MSKYKKMIDKYAPQLMELRNMEAGLAECKAGLLIMQIMDDTTKRLKNRVSDLYDELIKWDSE